MASNSFQNFWDWNLKNGCKMTWKLQRYPSPKLFSYLNHDVLCEWHIHRTWSTSLLHIWAQFVGPPIVCHERHQLFGSSYRNGSSNTVCMFNACQILRSNFLCGRTNHNGLSICPPYQHYFMPQNSLRTRYVLFHQYWVSFFRNS